MSMGLEYRAGIFRMLVRDLEPSAKTMAHLIDKVREEQIPAVSLPGALQPARGEIIGGRDGRGTTVVPLLPQCDETPV